MLPDEGNQEPCLERLAQIAGCFAQPGAFGEHVVVRGDENDRRRNAFGRQAVLQVEAAQSAEVDVEDDARGLARHIAMEEILGGSEGLDANPVEPKGARQRDTEGGIVVDDANPRMRQFSSARWT